MKIVETKTVKIDKMIGMECDVCGKEFFIGSDEMEIQEFTHISFTGGWGSVFGDGDTYVCDICQHCLKEKLGEYVKKIVL